MEGLPESVVYWNAHIARNGKAVHRTLFLGSKELSLFGEASFHLRAGTGFCSSPTSKVRRSFHHLEQIGFEGVVGKQANALWNAE